LQYKFPESGKYMGPIVWTFLKGQDLCDVYPTEYFASYTMAEFENREFMMFAHFDEILRYRYGDYMALPKQKDRISHGLSVYYIN